MRPVKSLPLSTCACHLPDGVRFLTCRIPTARVTPSGPGRPARRCSGSIPAPPDLPHRRPVGPGKSPPRRASAAWGIYGGHTSQEQASRGGTPRARPPGLPRVGCPTTHWKAAPPRPRTDSRVWTVHRFGYSPAGCGARLFIAAGQKATAGAWVCDHARVIVSLLYQVTRRLLSVPAVLLRRDTAKDVSGHRRSVSVGRAVRCGRCARSRRSARGFAA